MGKAKVAILYFLVLFLAGPAFAVRQNTYPIVLVHGLFGWGRDEVLNVKYWGGIHGDIQNDLNRYGYQTLTAAVGPVSSNWDRACELYAYIKGGTVDYGKVHSAKMGHARFGRTYPGIYPEWGRAQADKKIKKIHLLGHSQGGQTIRLLAQLLSEGSAEEIKGTTKEELSPLFQGNQHWISSVTALFTPHNGTSLADAVEMLPLIENLVKFVAAMSGVNEDHFFYDFKLDQWGLSRRPQESFTAYKNRVMKSQIWQTKDIASYDLSTEGAKKLNGFAKAQSDIFYFSASGKNTWRDILTGYNYPEVNMISVLKPTATVIGSFSRNQPGLVRIDSSWWPNDGLVPVSSAKGPTINSRDQIVDDNGIAKAGRWNHLGLYLSTDHTAIVGWNMQDPTYFFRSLADRLGALPQ
jgi:triacylglycerol lipase